MGRRQRHTEFTNLTDEAIQALINDPATPADLRRKLVAEQKYRGLRNRKKRRK
jgi:hypothetical protein